MTIAARPLSAARAAIGRARAAVALFFFSSGVASGTFAPHVAIIKDRLGLTEGDLGLALLALPVGAVAGLVLGAPLAARLGSAPAVRLLGLLLPVLLLATLGAGSYAGLLLWLAGLGLVIGGLDIAMNLHGAAVERLSGKPVMSSFHAWFSVGTLAGAGVAALQLTRVTPSQNALTATVLCLLLGLMGAWLLLPGSADRGVKGDPLFALPRGPVVILGVMAFFCLMAEGSVIDWSAVWVTESLGRGAFEAALVFTCFSLGMVTGRFAGDHLRERFSTVRLLRIAGWTVFLSFGVTLVVGSFPMALVGYAGLGLGLSFTFPVLLAKAARSRASKPAIALAGVTTMGYLGLLAGPPLIGFLAEATSLTAALGIIAGIGLLVVLLAGAARRV